MNLWEGWRAFELSMQARQWRKAQVAIPLDAANEAITPQPDMVDLLERSVAAAEANKVQVVTADGEILGASPEAARSALQARIDSIGQSPAARADLVASWPPALPTLKSSPAHTPAQLAAIEQMLDDVEGRYPPVSSNNTRTHSLTRRGAFLMTNSIPLAQLESSSAASFNQIGDKHAGTIIAVEERQQTDPKTGAGKTFKDGSPMMLWVITIQLADGDSAALWAKGGKFKSPPAAGSPCSTLSVPPCRRPAPSSLDIGGQLAVAFTGEGVPKERGMNPPKLYTAQYRPPAPQATSVPVEDLFS